MEVDPQHMIAQCNPANSGILVDKDGNKVGFQATMSDDHSVVFTWILPKHFRVDDAKIGSHFMITVAELHAILDFASQCGF
jgi:hypothetical protein